MASPAPKHHRKAPRGRSKATPLWPPFGGEAMKSRVPVVPFGVERLEQVEDLLLLHFVEAVVVLRMRRRRRGVDVILRLKRN